MRGAAIVLAALALAAAAFASIGASLGWFSGKRPAGLGFQDAKFRAEPNWKPNWVSSTAPQEDKTHYIAPFEITGDRVKAWAALDAAITGTPGACVAQRNPGYLHVEFTSRRLGFVDDAEFAMDASGKRIQVRSAARLGVSDLNVNRERLERLRAAVAAAG